MKIIWCMFLEIWSASDTIFSHFGQFSALYTPPSNNPENQNFEKIKKMPVDIIISHMCTINENHIWWMFLEIWSATHNFFSHFGHFFFPFTPLTIQKIKILKKWKKLPRNIIISHKCTINDNHMMYDSWDMKHDRIFCYFGLCFTLSPP